MTISKFQFIFREFEPSIFQNNNVIIQKKTEEKTGKKKKVKISETKEHPNKENSKCQEKIATEKKSNAANSKMNKNSSFKDSNLNYENSDATKETKKENTTSCRCMIL
jgi:hypothetical protein